MYFIKTIAQLIFNKLKIISFLEYYLIVCYFLIFGSLGSNVINLLNHENINNIHSIADLRSIFPILIFFLNTYYIFKKKIKTDKIEKIFICLVLCYFIGTLFNLENNNNFKISFIFNPLALISTHIISKRNLNITYRLGVFIFFISIVLVLFYSQNRAGYGGGWINILGNNIIFINSNGASRLICFVNLLLLTNLVYNKKYIEIKSIISILCIITLTALVIISEGRVNIGIVLISSSIIFLNKNILFLKKLLLFLFIIVFSFNLSNNLYKLNSSDLSNKRFKFKLSESPNNNLSESLNSNIDILFQYEKNQEGNWNRFNKWGLIVNEISKSKVAKIFFGSGPEHDRVLLKDKGLKWNADAASGLLYSLLCGGVIAAIMYFLVLKKTIYNLFFFIKDKNFLIKKSYSDIFCFTCPLLLIIRSLFENGFTVWGVDFIIIIISLSHIENKYHLEN